MTSFFIHLNFFTNVKNMYEKRIFLHHLYFFREKNNSRFEKIENHVEIFTYWFWSSINLKNV